MFKAWYRSPVVWSPIPQWDWSMTITALWVYIYIYNLLCRLYSKVLTMDHMSFQEVLVHTSEPWHLGGPFSCAKPLPVQARQLRVPGVHFLRRWALASLWKPWPTDGLSHRLYHLPATFTWGLFESQPLLVKQGMVLRQGFMYLGNGCYQILVPDVPSNNQHQKIWFEEF